ncbi:MAG: hypothetical protein MN733_22960 [Nitrososphaera sp.]|nr:hypothetical protein [Nitrososphaera sp.]
MDAETAIKVIDKLIQAASFEINDIKAQITGDVVMQVAIYSHDHIGADRLDFGVLSNSPSLGDEYFEKLGEIKAVLLDREQRRNALKHLKHLLEEGNTEIVRLLQEELQRFFNKEEMYQFLLEPELEYPNEHVKSYPYS